MNLIRLGSRVLHPAWFDMSYRFSLANMFWRGKAFRIGDRAAAYLWLADWRKRNPERKLTVYEDSIRTGTENSKYLPGCWLFNGIADELIVFTRINEKSSLPIGERLYHVNLWRIWSWLTRHRSVDPKIKPLPEAVCRVDKLLYKHKVPRPFAVVNPLFDAKYDTYRNQTVQWWHDVVFKLGSTIPVVLIGAMTSVKHMKMPDNIFPLCNEDLNPMESLAVINQAGLYIGGATGMTLWAAIFKIPVLACYKVWAPHPGKKTDTRPISCGAPVVFCPLGNTPEQVALMGQHMFQGVLKESTPL